MMKLERESHRLSFLMENDAMTDERRICAEELESQCNEIAQLREALSGLVRAISPVYVQSWDMAMEKAPCISGAQREKSGD